MPAFRSATARLTAAALVLAGIAGAVQATPVAATSVSVTLTGWAYGSGGTVHATTPVGSYNGAAGAFAGSLSGAGLMDAASFVTYCIEIEENFSFGAQPMNGYKLVDGEDYFQQRRGDAGIAEDIGRLLTYAADHPAGNAAASTALQLALWNVVYDGDASVGAGSFRDTSGYAAAANVWLAGAQGTVSRYDVWALTRGGSQDFVVASLRPTNAVTVDVPEPGTLGLAALALASLVLLTRRHRAD